MWGSNQGLFGRQGTFAEYAAVDENWLYPTPANVTDESAGRGRTGRHHGPPRLHRAQLQAGDALFVNGGTGGVGSTVVQMAKAMGGASPRRRQRCQGRRLQETRADAAWNYQTDDIDARIKEFAPEV